MTKLFKAMNNLILTRDLMTDQVTHGKLQIVAPSCAILFSCFTLELPWKDNKPQISCIPPGQYKLIHRSSPKYGNHLHVLDVPGRSYILIHPANYVSQLRGCIAPGTARVHLNGDNILDVSNSRVAMEQVMKHVKDFDTLTIK